MLKHGCLKAEADFELPATNLIVFPELCPAFSFFPIICFSPLINFTTYYWLFLRQLKDRAKASWAIAF